LTVTKTRGVKKLDVLLKAFVMIPKIAPKNILTLKTLDLVFSYEHLFYENTKISLICLGKIIFYFIVLKLNLDKKKLFIALINKLFKYLLPSKVLTVSSFYRFYLNLIPVMFIGIIFKLISDFTRWLIT